MYKDVFVVIPSYKPDKELLLPFIDKLVEVFRYVIVVDDGGNSEYEDVFKEVKDKGAIVLTHYINSGKGRAIKTGLNYIFTNYKNVDAIVTADGDGQHAIEDIKSIADKTIQNQNAYVLGARDFSKDDVPFKSKFGNILTRNIFKMFIGLAVTDTQTGLRGMSLEVAKKLYAVNGERYEYETNTLIACKEEDIPLVEDTIKTIYIDNNSSTHFNPIKDSYVIYKQFFKYIFASVSSFLLDLLLFTIFIKVFAGNANKAFISTVIARILSSLYNYFINSKMVFKKYSKSSIYKYFILVVVMMLVSAFVVNAIGKIYPDNLVLIKIIVDVIIFIMNYVIQREWVFKGEAK